MTTLIIFIFLVNFSLATAQTWHIIGGSRTNILSFPYQISLKLKQTNKHKCGGTIISNQFIITAAHCICLKIPAVDYYVFAGSTTLDGKGEIYNISAGYCHEKYDDRNRFNDVALIKTESKLSYSHTVYFIRLRADDIPTGTRLITTGWGMIKFPTIMRPNHLQVVRITAISQKECEKFFGKRIKSFHICTLEKNKQKGTCKGDSGGPITFGNSLVGVVSWGIPCAIGLPDIYTKVSFFIPWIKNTISKYCNESACQPVVLKETKKYF